MNTFDFFAAAPPLPIPAGQDGLLPAAILACIVLGAAFLFLRRSRSRVLFSEATIAETLAARLKPYRKAFETTTGTKVQITGTDCRGLIKEDYPWKETIQTWINTYGADVEYILKDPPSDTVEAIKALRSSLPIDKQEKLSIYTVHGRKDGNLDADGRLIESLEKRHFTIFSGPSLLWIEGLHERGATKAYDCTFLSAKNLSRSDVYTKCQGAFSRLRSLAKAV